MFKENPWLGDNANNIPRTVTNALYYLFAIAMGVSLCSRPI